MIARRSNLSSNFEHYFAHNFIRIHRTLHLTRAWSALGRSRPYCALALVPRSVGWAAVIKGEAKDDRELFEFTIEPFVTTGFMLTIRYSGDCHHNVTGAGVWPTIEKAKQIAQDTATRLLHGAIVSWRENAK